HRFFPSFQAICRALREILVQQTPHFIRFYEGLVGLSGSTNERTTNPSAGLSQMALALSPNGEFLAVLLHHTLSFYRLRRRHD
ncbi:MAG: hypothetical protein ABR987_06020, partial [Terracidiphilus sp.]